MSERCRVLLGTGDWLEVSRSAERVEAELAEYPYLLLVAIGDEPLVFVSPKHVVAVVECPADGKERKVEE